jgi:hypothetical protein
MLGPGRQRLLVAQVDEKTLALAVGGGDEFLVQIVKAARGGQTLAANPDVRKALAEVPGNRILLAIVNVAQMGDVMKKTISAQGDEEAPVLKLDSPVPLMLAVWAEGTHICGRLDLPLQPLKQSLQAAADMVSHGMKRNMKKAREEAEKAEDERQKAEKEAARRRRRRKF